MEQVYVLPGDAPEQFPRLDLRRPRRSCRCPQRCDARQLLIPLWPSRRPRKGPRSQMGLCKSVTSKGSICIRYINTHMYVGPYMYNICFYIDTPSRACILDGGQNDMEAVVDVGWQQTLAQQSLMRFALHRTRPQSPSNCSRRHLANLQRRTLLQIMERRAPNKNTRVFSELPC